MVLQAIMNAFGRNARDIQELKESRETIKLLVHVITVTNDWMDIITSRRIMQLVGKFWSDIGIEIQPSFSFKRPSTPLTYEDDSIAVWHYENVHGPRLTLYIDPQASTVGFGYWGQVASLTGVYGTAIIAGLKLDMIVAQIVNHEMGHWLLDGTNDDHEKGTFMWGDILVVNTKVTPEQQEKLREGAYRWGGY